MSSNKEQKLLKKIEENSYFRKFYLNSSKTHEDLAQNYNEERKSYCEFFALTDRVRAELINIGDIILQIELSKIRNEEIDITEKMKRIQDYVRYIDNLLDD